MVNSNNPAFQPGGPTVHFTAGTASSNVHLQPGNNSRHVRIWNSGTVTVFVEFGNTNTVAASTTTSMPIPAGNTEVFSCPRQYIAGITASGSAVVYCTPGEGL